ncbi:MAG TPA: outer membrane beta-barrel protein, partial [Flavisolibacter sp.]|nr:outer membrane beta-barrel protein [Flavisolibacter sp.]
MHRFLLFFLLMACAFSPAGAQPNNNLLVTVTASSKQPLSHTTVELLKPDSSLVKIFISDSAGLVRFENVPDESFILRASRSGYHPAVLSINTASQRSCQLMLSTADHTLQNVMVSVKKSFIELRPDKTVVNMEAGIANVGTTALEALEKLPGVTVDKDGNISFKGRSGVMVMMDGKPTYLNGAELTTLLSGMSASQISQVELMDNPPAKYDAAGNAGVINIKTKKSIQRGFNGTLSTSYGQGYYPKSNNNLSLNYRSGKWNVFANIGSFYNAYFTRIYALRTYFKADGKTIASLLEQPSFLKGNLLSQSLRAGVDYELGKKTSLSLTLTGTAMDRKGNSNNPAYWMNPNQYVDSLVYTRSTNATDWKNGGGSLHLQHSFTSSRELTADVDVLHYRNLNNQFFENTSIIPSTYSEASMADIPGNIRILSAKADYSEQLKNVRLEAGWKSSNINTDNQSIYKARNNGMWQDDWGRSNHFLYKENIHALYGTLQSKFNKWSV